MLILRILECALFFFADAAAAAAATPVPLPLAVRKSFAIPTPSQGTDWKQEQLLDFLLFGDFMARPTDRPAG